MSTRSSQALIGALFALILNPAHAEIHTASAPARHEASAPVYRVNGTVKAIAPNALTLAHEAIPELKWPAMTMPFALADGLTLPSLNIDQPVVADVSLVGGRYVITAITPRD